MDWECAKVKLKTFFPELYLDFIFDLTYIKMRSLWGNNNVDSKYCWWIKTNIHSNNIMKLTQPKSPEPPKSNQLHNISEFWSPMSFTDGYSVTSEEISINSHSENTTNKTKKIQNIYKAAS